MALFPYMELQATYDAILNENLNPWDAPSAQVPLSVLLCPSDGNGKQQGRGQASVGYSARSNIAISFGDGASAYDSRGPFFYRYRNAAASDWTIVPNWATLGTMTDGTSNTVMVSEIVTAPTLGTDARKGGVSNIGTGLQDGSNIIPMYCMNEAVDPVTKQLKTRADFIFRGGRHLDRAMTYAAFNTILPPNAPACSRVNSDDQWGAYPPQSNHTGGVNCGVIDGSVSFISDTVGTNGLNPGLRMPTGNSIWGVWGAFGSVNGGESLSPL
jgi:hypothetical protein